jgi:hypothetical protein
LKEGVEKGVRYGGLKSEPKRACEKDIRRARLEERV